MCQYFSKHAKSLAQTSWDCKVFIPTGRCTRQGSSENRSVHRKRRILWGSLVCFGWVLLQKENFPIINILIWLSTQALLLILDISNRLEDMNDFAAGGYCACAPFTLSLFSQANEKKPWNTTPFRNHKNFHPLFSLLCGIAGFINKRKQAVACRPPQN